MTYPAVAFRVCCSWCKTVLLAGDPGALTTHTICATCAVKVNAELDLLLVPVAA